MNVANEAEGRVEALRRIAACRDTGGKLLDLGGLQLTSLDGDLLAALTELTWLEALYLGISADARYNPQLAFSAKGINPKARNALGALPRGLFDALTRLELLDLSLNDLNGLPRSLAGLTALTSLDLTRNDIGAEGARHLAGLTALTSLNLSGNGIGAEGARHLAGLTALTSLDLAYNGIGDEGARHLAGLTALTSLDLAGNGIGAEGARHLAGLTALTSLNLAFNRIGDEGARHLAGLTALTSLDLAGNGIGAEGARHLAGLTALTGLNLFNNGIGAEGARHLAGLTALTSLDLVYNRIGDEGARHLAGLTALTSLNLAFNRIGDEGARHLAGLTALTSLNLSGNGIGAEGARHLAGLTALTSLDLFNNDVGAEGARHLAGLTALTSLDLTRNDIGAEGARHLAGLTALTSLNLSGNGIGAEGARHLAGLTALTSLDLAYNGIGDEGARHLAGLTALTSLNLAGNGDILDLSPLLRLSRLEELNCSRCRFDHPLWALWLMPSLRKIVLHQTRLPGVPAEVLSPDDYTSCLESLRAHYGDLDGEGAEMPDVKLMILGNGRVGKTKLARRLRGEKYGTVNEPSTHGVQVTQATLDIPGQTQAALKIWDFGGQDIYHGTHALFLKSRAVFPILWTPASELLREHEYGGFAFRNQPLGYWLAYVKSLGGPNSPVLIVQSQADDLADERKPELPGELLAGFSPPVQTLAYSAKKDRKRGTLNDALVDAVTALRDRDGVVRIGNGRAWVKSEIERKRAAGMQFMTQGEFAELCKAARGAPEGGRVSDDGALLAYLHDIGTVFYRGGLFGDRIILDQAWALDAVYAVFDREKSWPTLKRYRGRFTRADLHELVWGMFRPAEQELFLSFMVECGIAFVARQGDAATGIATEYIAPDLLPDREDRQIAADLRRGWDEPPERAATPNYDLLAPGLMRGLISKIGSQAGDDAVYWRDGFLIYDAETGARGLVEQNWPKEGWAGTVRIATERGRADALFDKLIALVEKENKAFGLAPEGMPERVVRAAGEREMPGSKGAAAPTFTARRERPAGRIAYVSYAWADPTDPARAEVVDRLCAEAKRRGITIARDIESLKVGDNIRAFMKQIGTGDRIFIALSEKYWRSAYCMFELYEIWRNCRLDAEELRERTRVFALPCAKLSAKEGLEAIIEHWKKEDERIGDLLALERADKIRRVSDQEVIDRRMLAFFISQLEEIRTSFQEVVRPGSVDDYIDWAIADMPAG